MVDSVNFVNTSSLKFQNYYYLFKYEVPELEISSCPVVEQKNIGLSAWGQGTSMFFFVRSAEKENLTDT